MITAVTAVTPLQPLTDYKNNKSKSRKNRIFPKGLVHGFGQKLAIFDLANQNVLECILERKKAFPHYKSNKLKKSKIWDFPKIVHGVGQKLAMFLSLC